MRYFLILFVYGWYGPSVTTIPESYMTIEMCKRAGEQFLNQTNHKNSYTCVEGPGR